MLWGIFHIQQQPVWRGASRQAGQQARRRVGLAHQASAQVAREQVRIPFEREEIIQAGFAGQVRALADGVGLTSADWQTRRLLVNPPTLHVIAATLLAELHGRMGYFPPVLRLRPIPAALPPEFEVAEIINLQAVRDSAREQR